MSEDRRVPVRPGARQDIQLHGSGESVGNQLIKDAISNLTDEQRAAVSARAAEEAVRLEVKRAEQAMDYVEGRKHLEDHIEAFDMLQKDGRLTRHSLKSDIKTGAGKMTVESKSGATCFVATAAFGDVDDPTVVWLRSFRDRRLMPHRPGRAFVKLYWRIGPPMAEVVRNSRPLQAASRKLLSGLVAILRFIGA